MSHYPSSLASILGLLQLVDEKCKDFGIVGVLGVEKGVYVVAVVKVGVDCDDAKTGLVHH